MESKNNDFILIKKWKWRVLPDDEKSFFVNEFLKGGKGTPMQVRVGDAWEVDGWSSPWCKLDEFFLVKHHLVIRLYGHLLSV